MAKLVNIQTKVKNEGKEDTSFNLLIVFVKQAPAQGLEQFWRRMEIVRLLRDKQLGDEVEFTVDQAKELKEYLNSRQWAVMEEFAEVLESYKPVL